jgi:hypothetical protein
MSSCDCGCFTTGFCKCEPHNCVCCSIMGMVHAYNGDPSAIRKCRAEDTDHECVCSIAGDPVKNWLAFSVYSGLCRYHHECECHAIIETIDNYKVGEIKKCRAQDDNHDCVCSAMYLKGVSRYDCHYHANLNVCNTSPISTIFKNT